MAREDFDFDIPPKVLRKNIGKEKVFPGGPVCEFNVKNIPTFITNSESGGITPDILVEVLKHLDKSEISNRKPVDPAPVFVSGWPQITVEHTIS